jgi:hypothetical protein
MVGARLPATCGEGEVKRVATAIWAGLHGTALLTSARVIPVGGPRDEGRAEAEGTSIARSLIERFSEPKMPSQRRGTGQPSRESYPFRVALFSASGVGQSILLGGSSWVQRDNRACFVDRASRFLSRSRLNWAGRSRSRHARRR